MSYLYLILESLLPVVATIALKLLDYKTKFRNLPYWVKQIIYAVIFGGLAIFGTECGVVINEGVINVRDAPPIIAGLFFGAPAGIAAGLIGGLERLITGYFIAGRAATRIACSIATILAGILAATLRITTRKGKKVQAITACTLAFVVEVFHMLLVYLTNTNDLEFVIGIYRKVVGPMIVANVFSVFLASWTDILIDRHFANEKLFKKIRDTQLSGAIQQVTLLIAVLTFVTGFVSINVIQTRISKENISDTLVSTSKSVSSKSTSLVNYALGEYASDLARLFEGTSKQPDDFKQCFDNLKKDPITKKEEYEGCYEGYLVEADTTTPSKMVVQETSDKNSPFAKKDDVANDPLFIDLKAKLDSGSTRYFNVLEDLRTSVDGKKAMVLYSIAYYDRTTETPEDKYLILSMNLDMINSCVDRNKEYILNNQTFASGATVIFGKNDSYIGSTSHLLDNREEEQRKLLELQSFDTLNQIEFLNDEWYSSATNGKLIRVYSIVTIDKAELPARVSMYSTSFLFTVSVGLIFLVANILIDRMVVRKMEKVGDALDQISGNNLNTKVDVYGFEEFNKLSTGINHTVDRLRGYIEEEKDRINKDLKFAHSIQKGTLPYTFPTDINYDLYADMKAAKEVGGDFYDFFPLPNNRLFFLIADVSGKGVPAAMFMMRAETLIKSLVQSEQMSLDKIVYEVNNRLCTNNDAQMFVTCWCGILDTNTGHLEFVNAGHNPPIIRRHNGHFEEMKVARNFILAGLENMPYLLESIDLNPEDEILLYTDGVTEATDKNKTLYGVPRLLKFMNEYQYANSKVMIQGIMDQLHEFQKDTEQADDITMLMIRYKPESK